MTQLEKTIEQILSERMRIANQEKTQREAEKVVGPRIRKYTKEFDSIYQGIPSIGQIEMEFIGWANQCKIDDERKEIADGAEFYQNLLQKARSTYQKFREEGYEPKTAFDNGTEDLICWIKNSTQKASGGTIYLNYSPEFLHRLRHMRDD